MVYLAWFAHVTHLSTLTFLRRYLFLNTGERNWRVASMALLVCLLVVAEVPTGFFSWSSPNIPPLFQNSGPSPANATSQARCFFDLRVATTRLQQECTLSKEQQLDCQRSSSERCLLYCRAKGPGCSWNGSIETCEGHIEGSAGFQSMMISVLLILFSTATRTVKMYRGLSSSINKKIRAKVSKVLRRCILSSSTLLVGQGWTTERSKSNLAWLFLVVKPLIAAYLTLRLYTDLYASTASDVSCNLAAYTFILNAVYMGTLPRTTTNVNMYGKANYKFSTRYSG